MSEYGRHGLPECDRLGFDSTIRAVADAIRRNKDGRFNVGVYGNWGSGKSSFLTLLEKRLAASLEREFDELKAIAPKASARLVLNKSQKALANASEFTFVHFNAWRFRKPADAAVALVNAMNKGLSDSAEALHRILPKRGSSDAEKMKAKTRIKQSDNEIAQAKKKIKSQTDTAAVKGAKIELRVVELMHKILRLPSTAKAHHKELKAICSALANWLSKNAITAVQEKLKKQRYGSIVDPRYTLQEDVETAFANRKELPVVVFIDDLDRCLDEETVDILEAMKTVFDVPNCIFVIAADLTRIQKAIEKVRSTSEAYRYMDKIIQLSVNVPSFSMTADALQGFLKDHIRLSWLQDEAQEEAAQATEPKLTALEKSDRTDLFLRGVRANPRDMALAAEKYDLLDDVVKNNARLNTIVDHILLLKIALLQCLLGDEFEKTRDDPLLLRKWELGLDRVRFQKHDKQSPLLFSEILKPIQSAESGGTFAQLADVDLRLYCSLAAHDAGRATKVLTDAMFDVAETVEAIRHELDDSEKRGPLSEAAFESILKPYQRAFRLRYDDPYDVQKFSAALVELARSNPKKEHKRVEALLDHIHKKHSSEVFLIRWELSIRVTTLDGSPDLLTLVEERAERMLRENPETKGAVETVRKELLADVVQLEIIENAPALAVVSKCPVTNKQYEQFDPGHGVLRCDKKPDDDDPVSNVGLIEVALFCAWLNASNGKEDKYYADLPSLDAWNGAVKQASDKLSDVTLEKLAGYVWEWTKTPLDGKGNVLTMKALPHVWVCGGSWQNKTDADPATQSLWFPPLHHRPDVGFRIFWYNESRYDPLVDAQNRVKGCDKAAKEAKEHLAEVKGSTK